MNCTHHKNIDRWVDGELKEVDRLEFQQHLSLCALCQKEVQALKELNHLIRASAVSVEPSLNFEGQFWQNLLEKKEESWVAKVLRHLDSLIPTPNFAQAFATLLIALFIGGTGGFVATASTFSPEQIQANREAVQYLSGFPEFKGIPDSSIAASYLKAAPGRKDS